jgi:hypothetical protein
MKKTSGAKKILNKVFGVDVGEESDLKGRVKLENEFDHARV